MTAAVMGAALSVTVIGGDSENNVTGTMTLHLPFSIPCPSPSINRGEGKSKVYTAIHKSDIPLEYAWQNDP